MQKCAERTTISLRSDLSALAKGYATSTKIKFSNLIELALEDYLKTAGVSLDCVPSEIIDLHAEVDEVLSDGVDPRSISKALVLLKRKGAIHG